MNNKVLKFRKKPVVIDAVKWTGANLREIITFTSGAPDVSTAVASAKWADYCDLVNPKGLIIKTLEGEHIATVGDWIIKGVKGECYPCKPDIFELTYEVATPAPIPDAGEGVEVVAFLMKNDCYSPYVRINKDSADVVEPLMTVAQHNRIVRAILAASPAAKGAKP